MTLILIFLHTLVTKTNLSVHEDKYRVPYVKVSHQQFVSSHLLYVVINLCGIY